MANNIDLQDTRVQYVLALRAANRKIPVKQLARSVKLSESHLQHLIKQELGCSITRYLQEVVLQKAALLLTTTELTVRQIRMQCGISDASNFSHYFKERFGVSPVAFRRQQITSAGSNRPQDSPKKAESTNGK